VFVLGHPEFYPRFGFVPARPAGLTWEHAVPDDVFMVLELLPGALAGRRGVVRYLSEFAGL
jgi:putative acetyltransferase